MEKIFDEIVDGKRVIKLKMTETEIEETKKEILQSLIKKLKKMLIFNSDFLDQIFKCWS